MQQRQQKYNNYSQKSCIQSFIFGSKKNGHVNHSSLKDDVSHYSEDGLLFHPKQSSSVNDSFVSAKTSQTESSNGSNVTSKARSKVNGAMCFRPKITRPMICERKRIPENDADSFTSTDPAYHDTVSYLPNHFIGNSKTNSTACSSAESDLSFTEHSLHNMDDTSYPPRRSTTNNMRPHSIPGSPYPHFPQGDLSHVPNYQFDPRLPRAGPNHHHDAINPHPPYPPQGYSPHQAHAIYQMYQHMMNAQMHQNLQQQQQQFHSERAPFQPSPYETQNVTTSHNRNQARLQGEMINEAQYLDTLVQALASNFQSLQTEINAITGQTQDQRAFDRLKPVPQEVSCDPRYQETDDVSEFDGASVTFSVDESCNRQLASKARMVDERSTSWRLRDGKMHHTPYKSGNDYGPKSRNRLDDYAITNPNPLGSNGVKANPSLRDDVFGELDPSYAYGGSGFKPSTSFLELSETEDKLISSPNYSKSASKTLIESSDAIDQSLYPNHHYNNHIRYDQQHQLQAQYSSYPGSEFSESRREPRRENVNLSHKCEKNEALVGASISSGSLELSSGPKSSPSDKYCEQRGVLKVAADDNSNNIIAISSQKPAVLKERVKSINSFASAKTAVRSNKGQDSRSSSFTMGSLRTSPSKKWSDDSPRSIHDFR